MIDLAPWSRRKMLSAVALILALPLSSVTTLLLIDAQAATSLHPASEARSGPGKTHRLILQINTDDPTVMRAVISTSLNLPKYFQDRNEPFTIEIVAYNAGLHMFRIDTSPVKDLLQLVRTVNPGIRFVVCEASKTGMERSEGHPIAFIDDVQMVPSGPGHIVELQEAGWSYIRS